MKKVEYVLNVIVDIIQIRKNAFNVQLNVNFHYAHPRDVMNVLKKRAMETGAILLVAIV